MNKNQHDQPQYNIITNGVYRHFKGGLYKVLAESKHWKTGEDFVVCQDLCSLQFLVIPREDFTAKVDHDKYPDAPEIYCMSYKDFNKTKNLYL